MIESKEVKNDAFPVIILDYSLLGTVLTEYGRLYSHINWNDHISVEDLSFDEDEKILTAFIKIESETEH